MPDVKLTIDDREVSVPAGTGLVETAAGSILCDPWFVPAFFGAWFVFPRNDELDDGHDRAGFPLGLDTHFVA